jgi:hypothetical protein
MVASVIPVSLPKKKSENASNGENSYCLFLRIIFILRAFMVLAFDSNFTWVAEKALNAKIEEPIFHRIRDVVPNKVYFLHYGMPTVQKL